MVQWVHGQGETGPGPNMPELVAHQKPGDTSGVQRQKGKRKAEGRERWKRHLSVGCLTTRELEAQDFLIFIVITVWSSHWNEPATGLGCACNCSHCTVRNTPFFPPFLQYTPGWDTAPGYWEPHFVAPATSSSGTVCLGTTAFSFPMVNVRHYSVI